MKTIRKFDALGERYQFDARLCRAGAGWAQVDTTQGASYFGTWTNPSTRQILEFCEGDITLRTAEADDEYVTAVRELHAWNLERRYWKGIDPGSTRLSEANSTASDSPICSTDGASRGGLPPLHLANQISEM